MDCECNDRMGFRMAGYLLIATPILFIAAVILSALDYLTLGVFSSGYYCPRCRHYKPAVQCEGCRFVFHPWPVSFREWKTWKGGTR